MEAFEAVRRAAVDLHAKAVKAGADPWVPLSVVLAGAEEAGVEVRWSRKGDPALMGGLATFDPTMMLASCLEAGTDADRAILAAHEIGHAVLHLPAETVVDNEIDPSRLSEGAASGIEKVVDYGRRERRELQADLFARELVLPRHRVRALFLGEKLGAKDIASRSGLPYPLVAQQLLDALLLPLPSRDVEAGPIKPPPALDESQAAAADHAGSPFQLQAGPGTGKTRTLIARVERLIDKGIDPGKILVLTFSNKAAGELIDRLAKSRPVAAPAVWIGTFHAFGLDILRRFHDHVELSANPRLVDKADAVGLLEDLIPVLPLKHFRNFFDPTADIGDMLAAISRAKDEVCDPDSYRRLARAMETRAIASGDRDALTRAEKVLDVAELYEAYQEQLKAGGVLDFGDLVMRPVELVEREPAIREALAQRHQHVLVDEYQDVNRASVRLLKAIVGNGERLWVVGDARQSIYRFRGASSSNMAGFLKDFPAGKVGPLKVNYRSSQEVVGTFVKFAAGMKASSGMLALDLTAKRGPAGIRHESRRVSRPVHEGAAVAAAIIELHDRGVPFKDQAVICRGNARLGDIAEALEARDVPALYLGNLFERPDVKDLLSILALLIDARAGTLPRVAAMARTPIDMTDLAILQKHAAQCEKPLQWMSAAASVARNSSTGASLATLAADLAGFGPESTPWQVLTAWLLDRTELLRDLCSSNRPRDQIRRIGLWQLMAFCRTLPAAQRGRPIQRLLDRARRLALLSEERDLRQMPAAASGLDAVNLMTVHGSKGLEFDVVHMPGMTVSSFPTNNTAPRCTPPDGMIAGADGLTGLEAVKQGHDEEEQCLFFVGISRAHSRVVFYSSAKQANGNNRSPSPFLGEVQSSLTLLEPAPLLDPDSDAEPGPDLPIVWETPPGITHDHLAQYDRCPRRYFLTHVIGVPGARTSTPFTRMHDVVNEVMRRLRGDAQKWDVPLTQVLTDFDAVWAERGPTEHASAAEYHRVGLRLIESLLSSRRGTTFVEPTTVEIPLGGARVIIRPDEVRQGPGGIVLRRVKTGKERSNEMDDIAYALFHIAGRESGGAGAMVEAVFLTDDASGPAMLKDAKIASQRDKAARMAAGIVGGYFPAKPEARSCPRCPHYFTCGTLPGGALTKA